MMPDREKLIRALTFCCYDIHDGDCSPDCPYYDACSVGSPVPAVMYDVLALLKEREEGVTPIESTTEQKKFADRIGFAVSEYWCGDCHFNLFNRPKFCPNCGKKVKWDA